MKKKGRTLAACLFAAVWWGIFYPELCFSEETCEAVTVDETRADGLSVEEEETGKQGASGAGVDVPASSAQMKAEDIWDASGDEIVISSRFLEWLEENLAAGKD